MASSGEVHAGQPRRIGDLASADGLPADPVALSARRGQVRRTRTLAPPDAEAEARRLRSEGWVVQIEATPRTRATNRARKQLAQIIADHRTARRARQKADDAIEAKRAAGRLEGKEAAGPGSG